MKAWILLVALAVFALGLTACTQKQEAETVQNPPVAETTAPPPSPSPTPDEEAKEGKPMQQNPLPQSVPADFPVPIMEGAQITKVQIGGTAQQVEFTIAKGWQETASFYEDALRQRGFTVRRRDENSGGSETSLLLGDTPQGVVGASISQKQGESRSEVIVNWMKRD